MSPGIFVSGVATSSSSLFVSDNGSDAKLFRSLVANRGHAYASVEISSKERWLLRTDGTDAGTSTILESVAQDSGSAITQTRVIDDTLYFAGVLPMYGREPMVLDVGPTVPSTPTGVSGVAGEGEVAIKWNAPVDDGGASISLCTATAAPSGGPCTTTGALTCTVTGLDGGASYTFTVTASNGFKTSAPSAPPAPSAQVTVLDGGDSRGFIPMTPARLFESRPGEKTIDGKHQAQGRIPAGTETAIQIASRGKVPVDARAVSLDVTAINPSARGYITLYPCGVTRPTASNLNYKPGDVVPNAVLTKLDNKGQVCIYNHAQTDLVIDVNGAFD